MRPPEFTGGNLEALRDKLKRHGYASMRPPEFTGGNATWKSNQRREMLTLQ